MVDPQEVSAVVVTRGNVDLTPILDPLIQKFDEVVVWDNSKQVRDLLVFGRYAAISDTNNQVIYVQDDDVVAESDSLDTLCAAYEEDSLTVNMPERFRAHYSDSCLVGLGALFPHYAPDKCFERYGRAWGPDFFRDCDIVFTALWRPQVWVDVPYVELPYATGPDRLYTQPGHVDRRAVLLDEVRRIRGN